MADQPQEQRRYYLKYDFYKLDPAWRRLPQEERRAAAQEFLTLVESFSDSMMIRSYTCLGLRADVDFLLWKVSDRLEAFPEMAARTNLSAMGPYLTLAHSFLSMTRRSIYVDNHRHEGQEGTRTTVRPAGSKYFFVYPFVKTHEWYQLPMSERQPMMDEHIAIGHKYPNVRINTSYSYGLDDQEFVVAFEATDPAEFLDLVMALREAKQRPYTERDTPIFTCIAQGLKEILESLGG
ncbi:MAG: chlorite dismutase family protein [Chloroflexi bacterium]|nr:chlorite dismutase family protein [Chloroflexota bacterium]